MSNSPQAERLVEVRYVGGPLDGHRELVGLWGFVEGETPETITVGEHPGHRYRGRRVFTAETTAVVVYHIPPADELDVCWFTHRDVRGFSQL